MDDRVCVACVARYIASEDRIVCGPPGKKWLSDEDILDEQIKILNERSGKCFTCHSFRIAQNKKERLPYRY